ncbi:MAG: hypothetical protein PHS49_05155 [Candidatus Gracilibacteria bacterium]|nr:hypothetical protein [Candidatus Gracilibacteria bacterium]
MSDAFAQFKQGKSIEVQESERDIALNNEYKEPLKVPLDKQKKDVLESLYGIHKTNEVNDSDEVTSPETGNPKEIAENENITDDNLSDNTNNEKPASIETSEITTEADGETKNPNLDNSEGNQEKDKKIPIKIEDNKYYPIINRLYESEQITKESYESITKSISENNGELNLDNLSINSDEKKLIDGYITELDIKNEDKNILNFGKDIKDVEEFKDFNTNLDKNGKFDSEVLNIVGKNYLKIQVGDEQIDPKQDISTAIETTKNHILKEVKNIPKDSQTYLTAIENISSGNLKKQLEGINSLYVLSYSSEGQLSKKELSSYTKKRKEELKERAREITIEMANLANNPNTEKQFKLNLEKIDVIREANEIEGGDVFEAGDIDKVSEKLSAGKEDKS